MRTVLKNNSEVAHIWAQQNQSAGRCGNLFFEDKSIYSYGRHFEIARFINDDTVLFNTSSYSNTTAKHKGQVSRAISHKNIFRVPQFDNHDENALYFINKAREYKLKALRAVAHGERHIDTVKKTIEEGAKYVNQFKVGRKLKEEIKLLERLLEENRLFNSKDLETLKQRRLSNQKRLKTKEANAEIIRAQRLEKYLKEIEDWKNGILERAPYSYSYDNRVFLRIKDDRIETSKGAQVTVKTALRLWESIKAKQNINGFKIDNYEAQGFEGDVLKVGCHQIPLAELERIAGLLGVQQ